MYSSAVSDQIILLVSLLHVSNCNFWKILYVLQLVKRHRLTFKYEVWYGMVTFYKAVIQGGPVYSLLVTITIRSKNTHFVCHCYQG